MKIVFRYAQNQFKIHVACVTVFGFIIAGNSAQAELNTDFDAYPPTISSLGTTDLPNVLVVIDNSNSMDESATGAAVGSAASDSKSEIARNAVKSLITNFAGQMRMGLMAYQQTGVGARQLHNAPYDVSFDIANYNPASTDSRDSLTKKYRTPNTSDPGNYVYFNIALPFYSGGNAGSRFCLSATADFDNGSEVYPAGPWDSYRCHSSMTGTTDPDPTVIYGNIGKENTAGFSGTLNTYNFSPTDSDLAQNILDFGAFMSWYHIGDTWFSNSSPGRGYLHTPIALLDTAQTTALNIKLGTSQFASNQPTNAAFALQNAGLTPLEGSLQTARDYFLGNVLPADEGGPAATIPANVCSDKDFVVLVTDGLPSVNAAGAVVTDTAVAIAAVAAEASSLLASGVRTYVVGYALPEGVTPGILDSIAIAGGTSVSYSADDPTALSSTLTGIFTDIINRTSAGSAAAVISNNIAGEGALYQALYDPSVTIAGKTMTWGGRLHSIFIDSAGLFREDTNGNAQLDNYSTDRIVELSYDTLSETTKVYRYNTSDGNISGITPTEHTLTELDTIWDARDQLNTLTNLTVQRSYAASAATGRHIFTWLDDDNDSLVDSGETADFVSSTFPTATASNMYRYLDVPTGDVANLINFTRGQEGLSYSGVAANFRSRTIDYDQDGTDEVWRLGDVIHSSPIVVGTPTGTFHTQYNDYTYQAYIDQYSDRRQVLYVGSNDGMLHAFNGGFWDDSTTSFRLTNSGATATSHPLGSELWAYVPRNLLPHLQWLADPNYAHVYYVDGEPKAHDVRIFADDSTHPGGWGTILVVGMRFGGGDNHLDMDGDATDDTVTRSSYIVLDITDPESPPVLIAEINDPNLGYTFGTPTVVKQRSASATLGWATPDTNNWYLAFGSGPIGSQALSDAESTQNAQYYLYDLGDASLGTPRAPGMVSGFPKTTSTATSFAGSATSVDWDFDYFDDAVYFGLTGISGGSDTGSLERLTITTSAASSTTATVLDSSVPITAAPYTLIDALGSYWIYGGTGRFLTNSDNAGIDQQYFFGIKDTLIAPVDKNNLVDTTDFQVFADGSIKDPTNTPSENVVITNPTVIPDVDALEAAIQGKEGWSRRLTYDGTNPSARVGNVANSIGKTLLFVDYQPNPDTCSPEGASNLYALGFNSGVAPAHGPLGHNSSIQNNGESLAVSFVSLGQGLSSEPVTHTNEKGDVQVITQSSTAAVGATGLTSAGATNGRQSWRIIEDWRK